VTLDLHDLKIHGYEGGPYSHHPEYFNNHLFWIGYLASFFHGPDLEEVLLGPDYEASREFMHQIYEIADWPTFVLPFDEGKTVYVVCRTLAGDAAVDLLVCRSDWLSYRVLTSTDSPSTAPALSWAELVDVAFNGTVGGSTSDPNERLLLLLPALASGDAPEDAVNTIVAALEACASIDDPQAAATMLAAQQAESSWGESPRETCGRMSNLGRAGGTRTHEGL
jgi:hypothetical protein